MGFLLNLGVKAVVASIGLAAAGCTAALITVAGAKAAGKGIANAAKKASEKKE